MNTTIRNNKLFCLNCGESHELHYPIGVDELTKKTKAFNSLHKDCLKTWEEPTTATGSLTNKIHFWLKNGERGISSETMVEVMTGTFCLGRWGKCHPLDPDDFSRCYKLLKMVPELKDKLPMMKQESVAWNNLVNNWDKLTEMYEENVRINWKNYKQIGMYEFMQNLIKS